MANQDCSKCIHNAVCETAKACDGYVYGCKHFKEQKQGRWIDEIAPQTNADRIRAMSDEELAELICGIYDENYDDIGGKFINGYYIPCYDEYSIKEWLQQHADMRGEEDG